MKKDSHSGNTTYNGLLCNITHTSHQSRKTLQHIYVDHECVHTGTFLYTAAMMALLMFIPRVRQRWKYWWRKRDCTMAVTNSSAEYM